MIAASRALQRFKSGWALLRAVLVSESQALIVVLVAGLAIHQGIIWRDWIRGEVHSFRKTEVVAAPSPDSIRERVLTDPENRINAVFHVPAELKESVAFWLKIYTEYTTQQLAVFDARHPGLIYEVLDFRDLAKSVRTQMVYEIVRKRRVEKVVAAYRRAFAHLARNSHPSNPSREESIILASIAGLPHPSSFGEMSRNLHFQAGQKDNIETGLLAGKTYFPKMENLFLKMGLPTELTRLSLVESSFDLRTRSKAAAAGVWQFLRPSGKEYLLIDEGRQIDERISPLKATVAAGKLLKRNYGILGDWSMAVTSYNHGVRGLPRADDEVDSQMLVKPLLPGTSRLGFASRNYYAEFLAVVHAEAYRKFFYEDTPQPQGRPEFARFEQLAKPKSPIAICKQKSVSVDEFRLLNPDVRNLHVELPAGFWVALPSNQDDLEGLSVRNHKRIASRAF